MPLERAKKEGRLRARLLTPPAELGALATFGYKGETGYEHGTDLDYAYRCAAQGEAKRLVELRELDRELERRQETVQEQQCGARDEFEAWNRSREPEDQVDN